MLGIGAIIGTGIFVLTGQAAGKHAGPAVIISMVLAGIVSAFRGAVLFRVCGLRADLRLRLRLRLRYARRICRLDHRLGPDPRIRLRCRDCRGRMVGLCGQPLAGHACIQFPSGT